MTPYRKRRRKPMAEINVVPYIDVMLVLLIIFMVTTPLLTQGVQVDLPKTDSQTVETDPEAPEPMVLTVDRDGAYFIDENQKAKTPKEVAVYAAGLLAAKPKTKFLVRGDKNAIYNNVLKAMVLLKEAGIEQVNLVTEPESN